MLFPSRGFYSIHPFGHLQFWAFWGALGRRGQPVRIQVRPYEVCNVPYVCTTSNPYYSTAQTNSPPPPPPHPPDPPPSPERGFDTPPPPPLPPSLLSGHRACTHVCLVGM